MVLEAEPFLLFQRGEKGIIKRFDNLPYPLFLEEGNSNIHRKTEIPMTFIEYLKLKKNIADPESQDLNDLMDDYYDDYMMYLKGVKEGCSTK